MDKRLTESHKDLAYDQAFIEPMRELRETVEAMPWYPMNVNQDGRMLKVLGKGKTLIYEDGWRVQYCVYDQGRTIKKVVQISVKDHLWTEVPKEFRHSRANVILSTFFNQDNDVNETAILPNGGIQIAQDEIHFSMGAFNA